jgi:TonB family protein
MVVMGTSLLWRIYRMRSLILATLALSPMLIHAQVNSPAQPQSAGKAPVLESRLAAPKAPGAGAAAAIPTGPIRISSGVTYPKLVDTSAIVENADWHWSPNETERTAVVKMIVDANGTPTNLQVVKGLNPAMDADLVAAVSHYRFQPGTLNHKPFPIEVDLTVTIESRLK